MKKEKINEIQQNYAHDYRDMAMSEMELLDMLTNFLEEVQGERSISKNN
jgi:hypothetical protein